MTTTLDLNGFVSPWIPLPPRRKRSIWLTEIGLTNKGYTVGQVIQPLIPYPGFLVRCRVKAVRYERLA